MVLEQEPCVGHLRRDEGCGQTIRGRARVRVRARARVRVRARARAAQG